MDTGLMIVIILAAVLMLIIMVMFMSLYNSGIKTNGHKKLVEVNLEVEECTIRSISPAISGTTVVIINSTGQKLRFLVDDADNPGYRIGQKIQVAHTPGGLRLLKASAQENHYLYQVR